MIDLSTASFVDSSILGVILEGAGRPPPASASRSPKPTARAVSRVLDITGLRGELLVHPTRADAAEAARQAQDGRGS